jgi:hypothetical protein
LFIAYFIEEVEAKHIKNCDSCFFATQRGDFHEDKTQVSFFYESHIPVMVTFMLLVWTVKARQMFVSDCVAKLLLQKYMFVKKAQT